eukprot:NODE_448_length_8440_cov_0.772329.p3 type:complete len:289 gc:universal NODE_448_length_8440_cov_0.772329:2659-3525(+)
MSFVKPIQNGILLNKDGEETSINNADYLMEEGNQLPLSNVIFNSYTVKDVYIAYHHRELDYATYLLKASELDSQVLKPMDRIELLKMFTTNLIERPEWDTPVAQIPNSLMYWSSSTIDAQPILDAVESELARENKSVVRPIIIVPVDVNSMIHIGNIKQFIESGTIDRNKIRANEPPEVVITPKQYQIAEHLKIVASDSVQTLRKGDWDRVIAAFIQGHQWDFSLFPQNPLQTMLGVYVGFRPPEFKFPGLKIFLVDQQQAHKDVIVQKQIFTELHSFVASNKKQFLK